VERKEQISFWICSNALERTYLCKDSKRERKLMECMMRINSRGISIRTILLVRFYTKIPFLRAISANPTNIKLYVPAG